MLAGTVEPQDAAAGTPVRDADRAPTRASRRARCGATAASSCSNAARSPIPTVAERNLDPRPRWSRWRPATPRARPCTGAWSRPATSRPTAVPAAGRSPRVTAAGRDRGRSTWTSSFGSVCAEGRIETSAYFPSKFFAVSLVRRRPTRHACAMNTETDLATQPTVRQPVPSHPPCRSRPVDPLAKIMMHAAHSSGRSSRSRGCCSACSSRCCRCGSRTPTPRAPGYVSCGNTIGGVETGPLADELGRPSQDVARHVRQHVRERRSPPASRSRGRCSSPARWRSSGAAWCASRSSAPAFPGSARRPGRACA